MLPLPTSTSHATSDKDKMSLLARAFFMAATKASHDSDDILPQVIPSGFQKHHVSSLTFIVQEDGEEAKLSVFRLFCELFPEVSNMTGDMTNFATIT